MPARHILLLCITWYQGFLISDVCCFELWAENQYLLYSIQSHPDLLWKAVLFSSPMNYDHHTWWSKVFDWIILNPFAVWWLFNVFLSVSWRFWFRKLVELQPCLVSCNIIFFVRCMDPRRRVITPKWMVQIRENPMNKWMIWGVRNPLFLVQHPHGNFMNRLGKKTKHVFHGMIFNVSHDLWLLKRGFFGDSFAKSVEVGVGNSFAKSIFHPLPFHGNTQCTDYMCEWNKSIFLMTFPWRFWVIFFLEAVILNLEDAYTMDESWCKILYVL